MGDIEEKFEILENAQEKGKTIKCSGKERKLKF